MGRRRAAIAVCSAIQRRQLGSVASHEIWTRAVVGEDPVVGCGRALADVGAGHRFAFGLVVVIPSPLRGVAFASRLVFAALDSAFWLPIWAAFACSICCTLGCGLGCGLGRSLRRALNNPDRMRLLRFCRFWNAISLDFCD